MADRDRPKVGQRFKNIYSGQSRTLADVQTIEEEIVYYLRVNKDDELELWVEDDFKACWRRLT